MINSSIILEKALKQGFNPSIRQEYHHNHSEISLSQYSRNCRKQLYEENINVKKIYLDIKYWIYLRDVYLNNTNEPAKIELYKCIDSLANSNKIICPISIAHLAELEKIKDIEKRNPIIYLMNKYSKSVCFYFFFDRITEEIISFFFANNFCESKKDWKVYAIDKIGRLYGTPSPHIINLNVEDNFRYQKYFYDLLSYIDVSDFLWMEPDKSDFDYKMEVIKLACKHNEEKKKVKYLKFKDSLINEIAGFINKADKLIIDAYHYVANSNEKLSSEQIQLLKNLIINSFDYMEADTAVLMPAIYTQSCLNAYFMKRIEEDYSGNDINDFLHATIDASYCDYMFTEKKLSNIINHHKDIKIIKYFNTAVEYKVDEVIEILKTI